MAKKNRKIKFVSKVDPRDPSPLEVIEEMQALYNENYLFDPIDGSPLDVDFVTFFSRMKEKYKNQ